MTYETLQFLCLAKSSEGGRYCVAGKTIPDKRWVRPVNPGDDIKETSVSAEQITLDNGMEAEVGDVFEISVGADSFEESHQRENRMLNPASERLRLIDKIGYDQLADYSDSLADRERRLWPLNDKTKYGRNNCVRPEKISAQDGSLLLVKVEYARIIWIGKPYALFVYGGQEYMFRLTDKGWDAYQTGRNYFGECFLCVSLTMPFDGRCHKLVAAIINRERLEQIR